MSRTLARTGKTLATIVGLATFAAVVVWIGPEAVWRQVVMLRWVLPAVIGAGLLKHVFRAWAWKLALRAEGVNLTFAAILKARVSAQAFAYLSGMGLLVSEPLRPWLLRKSVPVEVTVAASLLESALYWFTSVIVTSVGLAAGAHLLADELNTGLVFGIWLVVFGAILFVLFTTTTLLPHPASRPSAPAALSSRLAAVVGKGAEVEARIRSFRHRHPGAALDVFLVDVLVQVVMITEVWVVLSALGLRFGLLQLAAIEAGSRMVKMMAFYLPGRLGADEAGAAGSFLLLGLDPSAGISLAIARRIQGLFWAAVGFAWLTSSKFSRQGTASDPVATTSPVHANGIATVDILEETS